MVQLSPARPQPPDDRRPAAALAAGKDSARSLAAEYTSDLLDLLNVLGRLVALEPAQADLLDADLRRAADPRR